MTSEMTSDEIIRPAEDVLPRPDAPERMRDLDFMLGDFRVEYTNLTTNPPTTGTAQWSAGPTHRGHFVEMLQDLPAHDITSRWIFGFNQRDDEFFSLYQDDWGNYARPTSPGWQDGHLRFTGDCFGFGMYIVTQEDFEIVDENHYIKRSFIQNGDAWIPGDVINCYRI
jgi:hypothetical protein